MKERPILFSENTMQNATMRAAWFARDGHPIAGLIDMSPEQLERPLVDLLVERVRRARRPDPPDRARAPLRVLRGVVMAHWRAMTDRETMGAWDLVGKDGRPKDWTLDVPGWMRDDDDDEEGDL